MNVNLETRRHSPSLAPTILVMEDERSLAKGLEMVLTEEGYSVDLAATGRDALDIFAAKPLDLLVADLRLPDINGMDVIQEVKTRRPDICVVVITGYANINSALEAMKLGAFDYLPKPFTDDEIRSAVEGALKGRKSASTGDVLQRVTSKEESRLIQRKEVIRVLEQTMSDRVFWKNLMEQGSGMLADFELSAEAKAAIVSGDIGWIRRHVGPVSQNQLAFIYRRLERETW